MKYAFEQPGYIKICGAPMKFATERYVFICPCCGYQMKLGTDLSNYGDCGSFKCQDCHTSFHATDEQYAGSPLHVYNPEYGSFALKNISKI